jgi:hypothetical protein
MILLIRFLLISLIAYLIFRSFTQYGHTEDEPLQKPQSPDNNIKKGKKLSKEIGEYIDYEEVDK